MGARGRGRTIRLAAAMAALMAAVLVVMPTASADTDRDRRSRQGDRAQAAPILFTQNATAGTLSPDAARPGEFRLALTGVAAQTIWFTERPARRAGVYATPAAIKRIGFDGKNAPNAVINLIEGEKTQDTLAVTLRDPVYDEQQATLQYRVKPLDSVRRTRLDATRTTSTSHSRKASAPLPSSSTTLCRPVTQDAISTSSSNATRRSTSTTLRTSFPMIRRRTSGGIPSLAACTTTCSTRAAEAQALR